MGYGAIARHLAPICVALGMKVLVADPYAKVEDSRMHQVPLETLLAESDFVVCLVVANEQTENLMNAANFARMKKSAYFINVSRGNLVDEAALMQRAGERSRSPAPPWTSAAPSTRSPRSISRGAPT